MVSLKMYDVLKGRILGGEKVTVEENGKFFVPYDEIRVDLVDNTIVISFLNDNFNVAWFKGEPEERLTVTGIEGRLKVIMG